MNETLWQGDGSVTGMQIDRDTETGECTLRFPRGENCKIGHLVPARPVSLDAAPTARTNRLSIRVSDTELDAASDRARRAGLTVSEYLRLLLAAQPK